MERELAAGVYESLHTNRLDRLLGASTNLTPHFLPVAEGEVPEVLSRHIADVVRRVLEDERDPERRATIIDDILTSVTASDDLPVNAFEQLLVLTHQLSPGAHRLIRPETPLSAAALLTNAKGEPSLGSELRAELLSADKVDLLCAFIRWAGIRILEEPLALLRDRGIRLRVITSTYTGSTERRAVDELVRRFGADVRISYETQSTRLHAKAWLFRRDSGFDTAIVGSSNLSRAALLDGLEWNVRLSGIATPELLRKFEATFDTYWADQAFVPYDPEADADRLDDALQNS
jgi:HKD family nuclease